MGLWFCFFFMLFSIFQIFYNEHHHHYTKKQEDILKILRWWHIFIFVIHELTHVQRERNVMAQVGYIIVSSSKQGWNGILSERTCAFYIFVKSYHFTIFRKPQHMGLNKRHVFIWYMKCHKSLVPWENMQFVIPIIFMLLDPSLLIRSIIIKQKA